MKSKNKFLPMIFIAMIILSNLSIPGVKATQNSKSRVELDVEKTTVAPIIDGSIDEQIWSTNEQLLEKIGEGDFEESSFGMLWDQQYLYIAIDIDDNELVNDITGEWHKQDSVQIFIDPMLHQSSPYQKNDLQIGLVHQMDTTTPNFHFGGAAIDNHKSENENRILRAIQTTDKGWSAEVAIPWDILDFDPNIKSELGLEVLVTDRDNDTEGEVRTSAWSAFERESFWNDTYGFGIVNLVEGEVSAEISDILLDEDFNDVADGELPFGWTAHAGKSDTHFEVNNGELTFNGKAGKNTARALAPVQWDDYIVEADFKFTDVVDGKRWGSLMFRASVNGENEYNQMAIRNNGEYEIAHRTRADKWSVPFRGEWDQELTLKKEFTLKTRVVGNNVKEYVKEKDDEEYVLLIDQDMDTDLLERGKIGVQADKSDVVYDNMKVTRVSATVLTMKIPEELKEFMGPIDVNYSVMYSDGIEEEVNPKEVKLYSEDESVISVRDNQLYPVKEGTTTLKAVYQNAEIEKQVLVEASDIGLELVDLQHESGYVLASVGEVIGLNDINFLASYNNLTEEAITGDILDWSTDNDQIEIAENEISPKQKGVYKLDVGDDKTSIELYLVVKDVDETEYVLLEEDFKDIEDSSLPEGWETKYPDRIGVNEDALYIDGRAHRTQTTMVLLPKYLGLFGDYKIEAEMTHEEVIDSGRWNSILYRVQNDSYPYYQMAVRQGASAQNGVEFAMRTPKDAWDVMVGAPFVKDIKEGEMHSYKVVAQGNRVQQSINDMLIIDTDSATSLDKGRIGLQAAGSQTKVESVRVTLQTEKLPDVVRPGDGFVKVSEPESKIALAPSIVKEVKTAEDLQTLTVGDIPATGVFHIDSNLNINDASGSKISTIENIIEQIDQKVIPAFSVENEATVDALMDYLKAKQIEDAFVLSSQASLVEKARKSYPIIRGIIDFSSNEIGSLMDVRRETNSHSSKVAILSQKDATKENIKYLQERLMTVWVKEDEVVENEIVNVHQMITSGPNGMIVNNTSHAIEALGIYTNNITLVRTPLMIGHRGIPALAPENTVESSVLAYEKGANVIETDIYLTKDNEVVILHDSTLNRTTTGSGPVENYTLAELKELKANVGWEAEYPNAEIPTLDEYFEEFKGKDTQLFVEIKSSKPEIVDYMMDSISKYDIEDQVTVISFIEHQLELLDEKMPGMSAGYLVSRAANKEYPHSELRDVLQIIQKMNTTYNPSKGGQDGIINGFMEIAKHRGVTVWPWTYRTEDEFIRHFLYGTYGLTTDYNHWASEWSTNIKPVEELYELEVAEEIEMEATVDTYSRNQYTIAPEIVILDGEEHIEVVGDKITAKSAGTVNVLLRHTEEIRESDKYDIYSQPVQIIIESSSIDSTELEQLIEEANKYSNEKDIYTDDSFVKLEESIEAAKVALGSIETEEELISFMELLQNAIDNLKINLSTLEQLIEEAEEYSNEEMNYTDDSFVKLEASIEAAKAVLSSIETGEELMSLVELLQNAIDNLKINLSKLEQLIEEAEKYSNEEMHYTEESYAILQEAISVAKEALVTINTPENLTNSLQALQNSIESLEFIVNADKLKQLIETSKSYSKEKYTEDSYQSLQTAIQIAENILDTHVAEGELIEPYMQLLKSIDNLVDKTIKEDLEQLLIKAKEYTNKDREYTKASFERLQTTIASAEDALFNHETEDNLVKVYTDLEESILELEKRVNVKELEELIEKARNAMNNGENYTRKSIEKLEKAIESATDAVDSVETEAELKSALENLQKSIDALMVAVDLAPLEELIDLTNGHIKNQEKYTKDSFNALEKAVTVAIRALEIVETEEELQIALQELQKAIDELVERTDVKVLEELIKEANEYMKNPKKYTHSSFTALKIAIESANQSLDIIETKKELDASLKDLRAAIAKLEEVNKPIPERGEDPEGDTEKEPADKTVNNSDDKTDKKEEKVDISKNEKEENELPKTATNAYNFIFIGMILVALALMMLLIRRRLLK